MRLNAHTPTALRTLAQGCGAAVTLGEYTNTPCGRAKDFEYRRQAIEAAIVRGLVSASAGRRCDAM